LFFNGNNDYANAPQCYVNAQAACLVFKAGCLLHVTHNNSHALLDAIFHRRYLSSYLVSIYRFSEDDCLPACDCAWMLGW